MAKKSGIFSLFRRNSKSQFGSPAIKDTYYIGGNRRVVWNDGCYRNLAKDGFMDNIVVNRAISMIGKNAASAELVVYTIDEFGDKKETVNHEVYELLKRPNTSLSGRQFIEHLVSYFLICGNAYVYAEKMDDNMVSSLELLRPDRIAILPDTSGEDVIYRYNIDNKVYNLNGAATNSSELLHFKNFHPLDDYYGFSSLEAAKESIEQHNECIRWNKALIQNGARPSGAIIVKNEGNFSGGLTDKQFEQIKSQLKDSYSGGDNAGKILVLEGGLDWKEMSISPKDMEFLETKNGAARDIALALGVPPQLLGIKGDNTYNNMSEARIALWEETIVPLLQIILNGLSTWFSNLYGQKIIIEYDPDSVSALNGRRQILWENLKGSEFVTDEEKREMLGFQNESES